MARGKTDLPATSPPERTSKARSRTGPFPPGSYKLEVSKGGVLAETLEFSVKK